MIKPVNCHNLSGATHKN